MPHDPTHLLLSKQNSSYARAPRTPEFKSSGPWTGLQFRSRKTFKNQCFSETIQTSCAISVHEFNHFGNSPEQKKVKSSAECVSSAKNECQHTPGLRTIGRCAAVSRLCAESEKQNAHCFGTVVLFPAPTLLFVLISLLWELLLLCRFLPFRNIFHHSVIQRSSPRRTNGGELEQENHLEIIYNRNKNHQFLLRPRCSPPTGNRNLFL